MIVNKKNILGVLSIPKSLFYDIFIFGIRDGIRVPILFNYKTKIKVKRGSIKTTKERIFFGFGGPEGISSNSESWFIVQQGKIDFSGKANFGKGSSIRVDSGTLKFGENFSANKNFWISINNSMTTGENIVIGSNVKIRDNDGHTIDNKSSAFPIEFGNDVWINDNSKILKGVQLGNNVIVGIGSVVTRSICKAAVPHNSIVAGNPSKIVKEIGFWKI